MIRTGFVEQEYSAPNDLVRCIHQPLLEAGYDLEFLLDEPADEGVNENKPSNITRDVDLVHAFISNRQHNWNVCVRIHSKYGSGIFSYCDFRYQKSSSSTTCHFLANEQYIRSMLVASGLTINPEDDVYNHKYCVFLIPPDVTDQLRPMIVASGMRVRDLPGYYADKFNGQYLNAHVKSGCCKKIRLLSGEGVCPYRGCKIYWLSMHGAFWGPFQRNLPADPVSKMYSILDNIGEYEVVVNP